MRVHTRGQRHESTACINAVDVHLQASQQGNKKRMSGDGRQRLCCCAQILCHSQQLLRVHSHITHHTPGHPAVHVPRTPPVRPVPQGCQADGPERLALRIVEALRRHPLVQGLLLWWGSVCVFELMCFKTVPEICHESSFLKESGKCASFKPTTHPALSPSAVA